MAYQTFGQGIAFAESAAAGDTTLDTVDVSISTFAPTTSIEQLKSLDQPAFYPVLATASVKIPALEALLRTGQVPQVRISGYYLRSGFGGPHNVGEIYLEMVDPAASKVAFVGSNSGPQGSLGVISPTYTIAGISRTQGPLGNPLDQIADGSLSDPVNNFYNTFFDPAQAKILGGLRLGDVTDTPSRPPTCRCCWRGTSTRTPTTLTARSSIRPIA
jgi:hypothetical protein